MFASLQFAAGLKIKRVKASDNPAQYAAFRKPLSKEEQLHHALDRLTCGVRPGEIVVAEQLGLKKWLDNELHPERVPENPAVQQRLEPFQSLGMGIHETYVNYPPTRAIMAFAQGRNELPDDPKLRAVIVQLAYRYYERRKDSSQTPAFDSNDSSDLELRSKLTDFLTADQIDLLENGKPDQKRQILAAIPSEKGIDFAFSLRPQQRKQLYNFAPVVLRRQLMLTVNPENVIAEDLAAGKLLRAIYGNHQLAELLDDFWFNHFNVFLNKGADRYLVPTYEREAIRPNVCGKFYDLLLATAKSPAMLFYLDNWQSVSPEANIDTPRRGPNKNNGKPRRGLNENYGRELLELHTLGVNGGYTQKDVVEVARCFTGWTIANPRKGGGFEYNDKAHNKKEKIVLGHVIKAGGGMNDGLEVLNILVHHPSTAHFISLKLAQRFVADDPPPSLVDRMAQTFTKTDGDLRQVMKTMFTSGEFWSQGSYRAKVKTPFEMLVSALRATNADVSAPYGLANELQKLGEPLYRKVEPTGYPNVNAEWVSSAALLERMNFGLALANNRVPGVKIDTQVWQSAVGRDPINLARLILEGDPSHQTRAAIQKMLGSETVQQQLAPTARKDPLSIPNLIAGLTLGSPEFQRR